MTAQIDRNTMSDPMSSSPMRSNGPSFKSNGKPSSNHYQENQIIGSDEKSVVSQSSQDDVKVQVYYCGLIMVVYIAPHIRLEELFTLLRDICRFEPGQLFTLKWVDEEGDPCTVSSQCELDEALRLYYVNKESELVVHVFANIPERPGMQCTGEDRSIYRRGARRWRKLYLVNGHKYQAKRFARTALCKVLYYLLFTSITVINTQFTKMQPQFLHFQSTLSNSAMKFSKMISNS